MDTNDHTMVGGLTEALMLPGVSLNESSVHSLSQKKSEHRARWPQKNRGLGTTSNTEGSSYFSPREKKKLHLIRD